VSLGILNQLQKQVQGANYESVVSFLNAVTKREAFEEFLPRIPAAERVCPGCSEATLDCPVLRGQRNA